MDEFGNTPLSLAVTSSASARTKAGQVTDVTQKIIAHMMTSNTAAYAGELLKSVVPDSSDEQVNAILEV